MESTLLHDFLVRSAAARPEATAIVMGEERLTYGDLDALSDRLSAALVEAGCNQGDRVAILVPKRPLAIVAMNACLKAGTIHVMLDPDSPAARLERILVQVEPRLVLAVPDVVERLDELAETASLRAPVWSLEGAIGGAAVRGESERAD